MRPESDHPPGPLIDTNALDLIARGNKRLCYLHPEDGDKCLKVVLTEEGEEDTVREDREYARLGISRLEGVLPVPRHFERVDTTGGSAAVRELVRDADGRVSRTLLNTLTREVHARRPERWRLALETFRHWLLRHSVVATDMTPNNICVRFDESERPRLVLVDGLGHRDRWPLVEHLEVARRWKLRRHIDKRGLDDMPALLDVVERYRRRARSARSG